MIFGGIVEPDDEDEEHQMVDNGQRVKLSNQSFYLDVTMGSIKRGSDLNCHSYYINNGGSLLSISNKLYALGFRINYEQNKPAFNALSGAAEEEKKPAGNIFTDTLRDVQNIMNHKKILHCYNVEESEFTEIHEGVFTAGVRKQSVDLDD